MDQIYIFIIQILLAIVVTFGSQNLELSDKHQWAVAIARYLVYILTIQGTKGVSTLWYEVLSKKRALNARLLRSINGLQIMMFLVCIAILVSNSEKFFAEDFPMIFIAFLIVEYPELERKAPPVNYGKGMACNFYEGYLMNVIPGDGAKFGGFVENIHAFESREGVIIPVKKLFIIITKTLYSPPDLQLFNKTNRDDLPKLEACTVRIGDFTKNAMGCEAVVDLLQSLDEVEKDVACVHNRSYKNSAYKIYRRPPARPVCLVAECATPLHTLHRVLENRLLYEDLADVDREEVCKTFCNTLTNILAKSSECRDKVELVYYDDTDPESNLADILLERIRRLEPKFEELISVRR